MAKPKPAKAGKKMTMKEFEGSKADREADKRALAEINRKKAGPKGKS